MLCYVILFAAHNISTDSHTLFSLESQASAAPSVYTKYSKGSKWSHAKPEPLSTDAPPTTKDQSSNTLTVETRNQATQYETQAGGSSTPLEAARVTYQPSTPSTTEATTVADNQLAVAQSLQDISNRPTPSALEAKAAADNQLDVML